MSIWRLPWILPLVFAACGDGGGGSGGAGGDTVLTMTPFTVMPGQEVFKCQYFKNPFGKDVDIQTFETHMSTGSHHLFLFLSTSNADAPLADCSGLEFHSVAFASQRPDDSTTYPDTVGMQIPATQGFEINAHYINATNQPIQAVVTAKMHVAPDGSVTQHAGTFVLNNIGIRVPPGGPTDHTAHCTLPFDANVMFATSHMHTRGTHFVASVAGTQVFQTDQWADPMPAKFTPPMPITSGTNISWTCTYTNETNQTLSFGDSAVSNVMCIFAGQYYPVPAGRDPTLLCNNTGT
jgi:hypothetical protein